ncbi:MAG TPA: SMC-Scp complex subunit ScpB [Acidimicrobiales bacterium]|nr:SMC-Scp complex subunit ScpB [Acidimicrobiales bacterium]
MEGTPDLAPETRRALEAIVMVAADPVPPQMLAQLLEIGVERVEEACAALASDYEAQGRGFVLVRVAGGYRYQSHPDAAPYVERYVLEGQAGRLSSAALETLSIVAYKQPLSRAQVAAIRGVNVDGVMRTLQHRGLVAEVARDPGPGQAVLYGTTPLFLERLGIDSVHDLPPIAAFVPGAEVVEALEHSLRLDTVPDPPEGDSAAEAAEAAEAASAADADAEDRDSDAGGPDLDPGRAPDHDELSTGAWGTAESELDGTELDGTEADGTELHGTEADGAELHGTEADGAELHEVEADRAELGEAELDGTEADRIEMAGPEGDVDLAAELGAPGDWEPEAGGNPAAEPGPVDGGIGGGDRGGS